MRSFMIATAMLAVVSLSGCSFTISGPCTSLSHQSRLTGDCGCATDVSCDSCPPAMLFSRLRAQPECPPNDLGCGMPNGMDCATGRKFSLGNIGCSTGLFGRLRAKSDCGCETEVGGCGCETGTTDCGCDGSVVTDDCGCDETSMVSNQDGLGLRLFQRGSACADDSCGIVGGGILTRLGGGAGCVGGGCGLKGGGILTRLGSGGFVDGNCGPGGCGGRPAQTIPHVAQPTPGAAGMAPSYVYPYYTTRGPRDFLMANPPSIGY